MMLYKITFLEDVAGGIYNPRTPAERQTNFVIFLFLAFATILCLTVFFVLTDLKEAYFSEGMTKIAKI